MKFVICFLENQIYSKAIFIKNDRTCTFHSVYFVIKVLQILDNPEYLLSNKLSQDKTEKYREEILWDSRPHSPPGICTSSEGTSVHWNLFLTVISNINKSHNRTPLWVKNFEMWKTLQILARTTRMWKCRISITFSYYIMKILQSRKSCFQFCKRDQGYLKYMYHIVRNMPLNLRERERER